MTPAAPSPSAPLAPDARTAARRARRPWILAWIAMALIVSVTWAWGTGKHSLRDLEAPVVYSGDGLGVLAHIRAYATGDIKPWWPKEVPHLGAPFGANWTDYPNEDLVFFAGGLFARAFGLGLGTNLYLIALQVLAGTAFLLAARALRYRLAISFAAAVLFAIAPYAFRRSLEHLSLTVYWHIPLALFALAWIAGRAVASDRREARLHASLAVTGAVACGFLNPYYLAAFGWLCGWLWLGGAAARSRAQFLRATLLLGLAAAGFVVQTLDTLWMSFHFGVNWQAVQRTLGGLDALGLRLPDLAFPDIHRWAAFQAWSRETYHAVAPGGGLNRGEAMTAYMGIFPFAALTALAIGASVLLAARRFEAVSQWYWAMLGTIAFAVVGGVNYLLGAFGFVLLRATNRLSIMLAAIALLWLCERMSRAPRGPRVALALAMLAIGPWDQVPYPGFSTHRSQDVRPALEADARFVRELEAALPAGAMVLQLPVKAYPESGPIHRMQDYEHLRPYLHSHDLRFSYGTLKGRGDSDWQFALAHAPVSELVARAHAYGFSSIYVNRKAYPDEGAELTAELSRLLGAPVADSRDLVAYRLPPPPAHPQLPPAVPMLAYRGFSGTERDAKHVWTWATAQRATVEVRPPYRGMAYAATSEAYDLSFRLESFNRGAVRVTLDGREVARLDRGEGGKDVRVALPAGRRQWKLEFECDLPPALAGPNDPRHLAFRIQDPSMAAHSAGAARP